MMVHDVFISYSESDKTVADATCAMLERHGIRAWIAPRDVTPGAERRDSIVDAITASRAMVLVLSASSNDSPEVRREVQRAFEHNITVIPFRVENVVPARALDHYIGPVHWLDALTPPLESHLERLGDSVRRLLTTTAPEEEAAPNPAHRRSAGMLAAPARRQLLSRVTLTRAAIGLAVLGVAGLALLRGSATRSDSSAPSASPRAAVSSPARAQSRPAVYQGVLDGDWSVAFARPAGPRYSGQLTMTGTTGTMTLTEYASRGRSRKVAQTMQFVPLDTGFAVRGSSPIDPRSGAAVAYVPDTLVFVPAGDNAFRVSDCDERTFDAGNFTACALVTLRESR
jgi:hypothetical protein